MKNKLLALVAVGMLAGPMAVQAFPVTWELAGTVDDPGVDEFGDPNYLLIPGVSVGDSFSLRVTFDTNATLLPTRVDGTGVDFSRRYEYDPSGTSFALSIGGTNFGSFTAGDTTTGSLIYLRDDSGDICASLAFFNPGDPCPEPAVTDGLSMRATDAFTTYSLSFILRSSILDIINGSGLPSTPDGRLAAGEVNQFNFANLDGQVLGTIQSIRAVPEPGTLALLGLGLTGLGFARRRKLH